MSTITNVAQFNRGLGGLVRSAKAMRERVQGLVMYALCQAQSQEEGGHGNLSLLTDLLKKTKPLRTIRTGTLEAYIFAHVANVSWQGAGATKKIAKVKAKKNEKPVSIEVTMPTGPWYDHDEEGMSQAKPKDPLAMAMAMAKVLTKAIDDGNVAEGKELMARQMLAIAELWSEGEEVVVSDEPTLEQAIKEAMPVQAA